MVNGHGSRLLEKIIVAADKLAVNLWVDIGWLRHHWIMQTDECGVWGGILAPELSTRERGIVLRRLIAWYERHGFCEEGSSGLWGRQTSYGASRKADKKKEIET